MTMQPRKFVAVVEFRGWPIPGEDMAERVRAAILDGPYSFVVDKVEVHAAPERAQAPRRRRIRVCQRMRRVIIESPYRGVPRAVEYARAVMADCLRRGEAPFASHLLYTQPGVLDDEIPRERELGIRAGLQWGLPAHATVVYTDLGITPGMRYGIQSAERWGRPVELRTLPGWTVGG